MKEYVLFLMIAVSFAACTKVEEAPVAPPVVAKAPDPVPTTEEAIAALLRAHPHSKKVCSEPSFDGYYIQWKALPDGAEEDGLRHGTFIVQKVKFYQSSNKTWFVGNIKDEDYVEVYPDLINLVCKEQ